MKDFFNSDYKEQELELQKEPPKPKVILIKKKKICLH